MWQDPIVAEVRRVRRAHAAQLGFDLEAIYNDLKAQEKRGQRRMISFPLGVCNGRLIRCCTLWALGSILTPMAAKTNPVFRFHIVSMPPAPLLDAQAWSAPG
jgi:hypothetical protein